MLPFALGALLVAGAVPAQDQLYEVSVSAKAETLAVTARFAHPAGTVLRVAAETEPFIAKFAVKNGQAWTPVGRRKDGGFDIAECAPKGCEVRYEFRLADAAKAIADQELAGGGHGVYIAPPGSFLVRADKALDGATARFRVTTAPGVNVACGAFYDEAAASTAAFAVGAGDLESLPGCFFGAFAPVRIPAGAGSVVEAVFMPGEELAHKDAVLAWIDNAARAVVAYYGRYPVPKVLLVLHTRGGHGTGGGMTYSGGGAFITVSVGKDSTAADLAEDWVLTHEMTHLTFPSVAPEHHWIEEGIATYVEPFARVRIGTLTAKRVWGEVARDMPNGEPEKGDRGLDNTPTWGRTYWGGAMFCLVADLRIREKTNNAKGLQDALAGIVAAGGNIAAPWSLDEALAAGDKAVGVAVLKPLYDEMKDKPAAVDLDAIFRKLGVVPTHNGWNVALDDAAPLAAVRSGIDGSRQVAAQKAQAGAGLTTP